MSVCVCMCTFVVYMLVHVYKRLCLPACMYCSLSVCLPDYLTASSLSVRLSACLYACLSACQSVGLFCFPQYLLPVCLCFCLLVFAFACLSLCMPSYLPACPTFCLPTCLYACLSACLPACLSVSQSVASILTLKGPCLPCSEPRDDGSSVIHTQILGSGRILRLQHRLAHAQHALQDCVAHDFR